MKKIVGIIVIILMIPVIISVIGDIDRTPVYPTTEFNIEKITRISSLDIENNIELPKLPNNVGDRWLNDGTIERKVGKAVINITNMITDSSPEFDILYFRLKDDDINYGNFLYREGSIIFIDRTNHIWLIGSDVGTLSNGYIANSMMIRVQKGRFANIQEAKSFFDGTEYYYQLVTPIIENAPTLPEFIDFYDGGSVIVDDGILDYTVVENRAKINYIEGNITIVVDNQFKISKPTKIISKSNDLYNYDLSNLPSYLEYGTLPTETYDNVIEFINNNQNKQIKIFFNDNIQESRYNIYLENDTIIINNDSEVIRIYNNDTYTSTRNLDINITYKLEGYNIIGYIDGEFDNTVLAFFWIIPVLLAGGLIYLLFKRKE